jgi:diamine N-acetyltransferase
MARCTALQSHLRHASLTALKDSVRLAKLTPDNVQAACSLRVKPEQEKFVAPVAMSLAEAYVRPEVA